MGASVRTEDEAFSDERYADLARAAGLADSDHARGKMGRLWRQCTIECTYVLPRETVVSVLGERGVEALVASRLGELVGGGVRIRGTKGRVEWLKKLRKNGKFGKRGGRPRRNPDGFPNKPTRVTESEQNVTPPAPAPAPAPAPILTPTISEEREKSATPSAGLFALSDPSVRPARKRKDKPFDCTADERALGNRVLAKLGDRNGVAYTGCDSHLRLIVERFREGRTELAMRKIIAYCAEGKKWEGDEKMREHLCPETLFGPQTISKYHDAAQSWAAREYPDDKQKAVR